MELQDVKTESQAYKTDGALDRSETNGHNKQSNDDGKIRNTTDKAAKQEQTNGKRQSPGKVIVNVVVNFLQRNKRGLVIGIKVFLLLAYFVYFGFSLAHQNDEEPSRRLIVCTVFGSMLILWSLFKRTIWYVRFQQCLESLPVKYSSGKRLLIIKW